MTRGASRRRFLVGAAASAGVLGAAAPLAARQRGGGHDPEAPAAADIGFCADMSVHHVQALAMCQRVLGRDTGDAVQAAAGEVLQNQAMEVGQMRAWLADWGQSTSPPERVMAWMGAGDPDEPALTCRLTDPNGADTMAMPGLATPEDMRSLSTTTGRARGRRWLELMRAHHQGGVTMARRATDLATVEKVVRLARAQVAVQTYEISQYDHLLAGEYA